MPKDHSNKTVSPPSRRTLSGGKESSPPNAVPNLLLKLLEACARHKRRHDREKNDKKSSEHREGGQIDWCHKELKSFARVLPRMEATIAVRNTHCDVYQCCETGDGSDTKEDQALEEMNEEDAVGHLCALYRAIARGAFCPHAFQYLFVDSSYTDETGREGDVTDVDILKGVLPRITKLLQYMALDPVRSALLPISQPPDERSAPDDSVKLYHQEEDVGSTIAVLLGLLKDDQMRLSVLNDLINLSNDLSTIDASKALFRPPISSNKDDQEEVVQGRNGHKIRVHVFTEVASLLRRRTNDNVEHDLSVDHVIEIPSQRSLLALRLGVWTALQHMVPVALKEDDCSHFPTQTAPIRRNMVDLINSLLSASRSTSLLSFRPSSHEPQFLAWGYSSTDVMVHSLLILRAKLAIVGLFTDIVTTWSDLSTLRGVGSLRAATSINMSLMAIEAAKYHLLWSQQDSSENPQKCQEGAVGVNHIGGELEQSLNLMCSWASGNFLALALLLPATTSPSKNDIWLQSFPHLLDCIPIMANSSAKCDSDNKWLQKVVVRMIHAILTSSEGSMTEESTAQPSYISSTASMLQCSNPTWAFDTISYIDQLRNRCLVKGYFSQLFELVKDSCESISGPTISVVVLLLESLSGSGLARDLVETACSNALGAMEANSDTEEDIHLVRLGSKRRKLESLQERMNPTFNGALIQSTLAHAILEALGDAHTIIRRIESGHKNHIPNCEGPKVVSLVSESDTVMLRTVSGCLRMLLSLRSQMSNSGFISSEEAIARLFRCVKVVSETLVQQKSDDKIAYVEPKLVHAALLSIVSVGLHACRLQKESTIGFRSEREAISHCAIATLPMIECDPGCDFDDSDCSQMMAKLNARRLCEGICCSLASMIGAIARPHLGMCLCGLVSKTNGLVRDDCRSFTFDEILPLQCRSTLLASQNPVASDSDQYETTLSSFRRILASSQTDSHAQMIVKTALLALPNLFLSQATRRDGHTAASAKHLIMIIDSFDIEGCVIKFAKSDIEGMKVSAMLSLSRLARIYTAASLVASGGNSGSDQLCNASSYLSQQVNPATIGLDKVVLGLLSLDSDGCFSFYASNDEQFHHMLGLLVFSNKYSSLFCPKQSDQPRHWMASLVYLQSVLALGPEAMLRSSNTLEFFSDKRHYEILDEFANEMNCDTRGKKSVTVQIPSPVWLFLMPFLCPDTSTRECAAKAFGQTLLSNGCRLFSSFFVHKGKIGGEDMNQISIEAGRKAVNNLFSEIDFLLMKFCGLSRDLLFSRELDFLPDHSVKVPCVPNAGIAIGVFQSLCRWSLLNTSIEKYIFQRSLLALIRIWIASSGEHAFDSESAPEDITCHSSLASMAFDGLREVFRSNGGNPDSLRSTAISKQINNMMTNIFSEFFLPPNDIVASTRYRLLSMFIGTLLLPSSATRSLQAQNTFEGSSVFEIMEFIDKVYPSAIVQMIKNEDHDAIQMAAAFRMYLLSEAKKMSKEEKRVQKKGINEFIIGTRQEKKRSGSLSRSLVPGVPISTAKLIENAKLVCIKTDVISHVLPQLLLHPGRAPLRFFTTKVCQSELNYPDILREIGLPVLKTLVWELGGDDPEEDKEEEMYNSSDIENCIRRKDVRLALTKGYLLREGSQSSKLKHLLMSPSQDGVVDDEVCASTARSWIGSNFMYLLVNLVLNQWPKRSESEKFRVIKCLRAMLQFLPPSDSPRYLPQIMAAINNGISSSATPGRAKSGQIHFISVATLYEFIKIVMSHDASQVGENLTTIVVALFPLFDSESKDFHKDLARGHAVEMLEWLASGEANENLPLYFSEIPFLPSTPDLRGVRAILMKKGVQLDDIHLLSQEGTSDSAQLETRFYNRINTLSQLILSHENQSVRKVVITYLTDMIKANRAQFQNLIVNEELSSMNFLTVVHDSSPKVDNSSTSSALSDNEARVNGGVVTKLLIRLLSRCVDETDRDIRDAIASCLGEIGAIDVNRLGKEVNSSHLDANSAESDNSCQWRLANPPWKTEATSYQLRLVTRHLVSGLKSAPTTLDQHKISFAIQELLKLLDMQLGGGNQDEMTPLLRERLQEADVNNIVEPFWTTNYKQVDTVAAKSPPFFNKSNAYFSWLSSFCRWLCQRSHANKNSVWSDFFHACRSAIRSQAGVGVAEFLLPIFILDAVCFGNRSDEDVIVSEILHVLSFEGPDSGGNLREREKAANAVFTVMDVLRHWMEEEMERKYHSSKGKSRRTNLSNLDDETSWPANESTKKIEHLLKRIPLSSCAMAASKVGMRARSIQFLEMEGRSRSMTLSTEHNSQKGDCEGVSKFLKSQFLDDIDLTLTQVLLGQLDDFDTMIFVAQKSQQTDLAKRLTEEATQREMYEDWEGALQAYEQLLDSRLGNENQSSLESSAIDSTKACAQKGLLRCLLKLGRLDSVLNQAYGMSKQNPVQGNDTQICAKLLPSAAEAAWRLGNWPVLDDLLNDLNDETSFNANERYQLSFGRTMHSLHSKSHASVLSCLRDSRESIMHSLSSAARDGYSRSYPYLMQLHAIREVEYISSMFFDDQTNFEQKFIDAVSSNEWRDRLEMTTPDITGSNAISNTRLALYHMAKESTVEGLMWLDIGKVARKGGLHGVAEHSLTQAHISFYKSLNEKDSSLIRESISNVKLQVAKLKHAIGDSSTALKLVEDDIPVSIFVMDEAQLKTYVSGVTAESGDATARRILQATEWMVCDGLKSSSEIKDRYQTVLKLAPNWERAHFHYAKFLDSLFETRISSSGDRANIISNVEECHKYLLDAVHHYGIALQLGQKHVYQALPRLLAMWLEFTSLDEVYCASSKSKDCSSQIDRLVENQELMNKKIKNFASKIPEHLFYTALPQLISRVVHKNVQTSKNVALILRTVLAKYPRQSLWSCGWLRFSKFEEKKRAGDEIFYGAQKILQSIEKRESVQNVLSASKSLFQFFISLAEFIPKGAASTVKMRVPKFDTDLKNFIPPVQAALSLSPGALEQSTATDVFPSFVPRMRSFNPELKIMQSKAKPKKVSVFAVPSTAAQSDKLPTNEHPIAQDVGEMHFLVKQEAKGDLRKDSRVQDLNNVINRIFASRKGSHGPNSRRRRLRLQLRTFSVVCLAEDCGILEWVPNTESLRSVITNTYNPLVAPTSVHRHGSRITNFADAALRTTFQKCQDVFLKKGNLALATQKFEELILKQYLPVMYWWFVQNFSSPHAWYEARTNFTLSTAAWSAVGHIIGLGDRHSENLLIDVANGECVHVDFDCIFDKGLKLPRPEIIPFRLTPNMLDSFGPTGADGMYTGALIESMRTLRKNRDTLLSVLEPFLNDPVINFNSKSQQKSKNDQSAKSAKDAKDAKESIGKIKGRLNGEYNLFIPNKKNKHTPSPADSAQISQLSVEGQVEKMIMEATSHENLVQVYVGWMPWI